MNKNSIGFYDKEIKKIEKECEAANNRNFFL